MGYKIIGRNLFNLSEQEYDEGMTAFFAEQEKAFLELTEGVKEVAYVLNGRFLYIDSPQEYGEYVQYMALKEGVNLVEFDNGNIGFVGYYGSHNDFLEVVTDAEKIAEYREEEEG